jgi:hypothetical protein
MIVDMKASARSTGCALCLSHDGYRRGTLHMSRFLRFIDALHETRQREARRIVSRYQRLIAEARDYDRHRDR